jgi:hypothetical protein
MKYVGILLSALMMFTGCSSIQKYVDQGLDAAGKAADKAAANYVDKNAGSGTYEDSKKMRNDQDKVENLLPYYAQVNKICDEKIIDAETRDELKTQFDKYYSDWKDGKIDKSEYDEKCKECIEKASGLEVVE